MVYNLFIHSLFCNTYNGRMHNQYEVQQDLSIHVFTCAQERVCVHLFAEVRVVLEPLFRCCLSSASYSLSALSFPTVFLSSLSSHSQV